MQIFIDSANLQEIEYWKNLNILEGVTTNPALLSLQNEDPIKLLKKISDLVHPYPVSAQVTLHDKNDIIRQAEYLSKINDNIVIKIPALKEYFELVLELKKKKLKINVTLCFDPTTALLFSKLNVDYISMIVGRSDDFNLNQSDLILRTKKIVKDSSTKILAASFRNPMQLETAISHQPDVITVPNDTLIMALNNPLSNSGLSDFSFKWKTVKEEFRKKYEKF
jgi:transaldolase